MSRTAIFVFALIGSMVAHGELTAQTRDHSGAASQESLWTVSAETGRAQAAGYHQAEALIKRGDALAASRRWNAARRAYLDAAEVFHDEGRLPDEALRRVANSYYYEGRLLAAVTVVDKLAAEAGVFGDLPVQARALADAAWLYGKLGRRWPAEQRLARLEKLMTSPYLPGEVREQIVERLPAGELTEMP